jgi:hypothetical protein
MNATIVAEVAMAAILLVNVVGLLAARRDAPT